MSVSSALAPAPGHGIESGDPRAIGLVRTDPIGASQHANRRLAWPRAIQSVRPMLALDRTSPLPLYQQIAAAFAERIRRGDLPAGSKLPPERALAAELGVTRSTVVAAYQELAASGLVQPHVGRGTTVLAQPPDGEEPAPLPWGEYLARGESATDGVLREILALSSRDDMIAMAAGLPGPHLLPTALFEAAARRAAAAAGHWLAHGPAEGTLRLRRALVGYLAERGVAATTEQVVVTLGAQQGIDMVARLLVRPGDVVVLESPTYSGAIHSFAHAGARLIGLPVDAHGLRIEALEGVLRRHTPKLIYTIPTAHNPTGAVLSPERRADLVELAARHQVPIVEDDTFGPLALEGAPPPALKALDRAGGVIYLGTFSKLLGSGLRLGFVVAALPVVEALAELRQFVDLHPPVITQELVAELLERGELVAHVERVCPRYRAQRDALLAGLAPLATHGLRWRRPSSGFSLWCELPPRLRAVEVVRTAAELGVALLDGRSLYPEGRGPEAIRICFGMTEPAQAAEGARRLAQAVERIMRRGHRERSETTAALALPV